MKKWLLALALVLILAGLGYAFLGKTPSVPAAPLPEGQAPASATTTEPAPAPESATVTAGIGTGASALGLILMPLAVVEDSRCPQDVQCIQAGTVRVKFRITEGGTSTEQVIGLGKTLGVGDYAVSLTGVAPAKSSKAPTQLGDYRFTFTIQK